MALRDVTNAVLRRVQHPVHPHPSVWTAQCRRMATQRPTELEFTPFHSDTAPPARQYDPIAVAKEDADAIAANPPKRRFAPRGEMKYFRGPLHPRQPPRRSDPTSRVFIPGPFTLPRLEQTYESTIAPDLMTLTYKHFPPGTIPGPKAPRLRAWTGDNPYFKNRPLRGPRGGDTLPLLRKPITFRNVPHLERITVHTMVSDAKDNSAYLHVAGMVLQAITGARATPHPVRKSAGDFGIRKGMNLSLTCELRGEAMYHFVSKLVDVVMPRVKDFRGFKGSSGDSSGNLSFGLSAEDMAAFPEIQVNYDMYPTKMIPGCHIFLHTSATTDYDARLLLGAVGVPFYGKLVD